MNNEQMDEIVKRIREQLGHKIDFIVLFGSQSTGGTHVLSDIDIGVRVNANPEEYQNISRELVSLFDIRETTSDIKIDLTLINLATLTLQYRIISEGRLLFALDEEVWDNFTEFVLSRYPDWNYYIENYLRQSLGA